jgi:hypothetical protein
MTLRLMEVEVEGYSLHYTFLLLSPLRASGELYTAISLVHRSREMGLPEGSSLQRCG